MTSSTRIVTIFAVTGSVSYLSRIAYHVYGHPVTQSIDESMSGKGKGKAKAPTKVIARDFETGGSPQTPGTTPYLGKQ